MNLQIVGTVTAPYKLFLPQDMIPAQWDGILCYKVFDDYLGVAEFSAPSGCIVIPEQLLNSHDLSIGRRVSVTQVELPKGTRITLKTEEALDWKHVLEQYLPKHYTTLQEGQEISVDYNGIKKICVEKCEPEPVICIIDTDLDLELDAPDALPLQTATGYGTFSLSHTPIEIENRGFVRVDGLAFIGPPNATSTNSYLYRVVDSIHMDEPFAICGEGSVTLSEAGDGREKGANSVTATSTNASTGLIECTICGNSVPSQSFTLHQAFCSRHTKKCTKCNATFHNSIPEIHWHCDECGHSETNNYQSSHTREHGYETCDCGYKSLFIDVSKHRATVCPNRLHICQFCHLLLAQGPESPVNRIQGYSDHEASCGTKTTNCPHCNKVVMLRNLANHMLRHEQARRDRAVVSPILCSNKNCPNLTATPGKTADVSRLGLCDSCYGVVYVTLHDPDQSKLRARIERRYMIQLTRGCGNSWCANPQCASGTGIRQSFKDATQKAQELCRELSDIWLCVDRNTSRRYLFLTDSPEFSREWKGMAITMCSTETDARTWLVNNAPRIDGT